jgi:hypothetical protein
MRNGRPGSHLSRAGPRGLAPVPPVGAAVDAAAADCGREGRCARSPRVATPTAQTSGGGAGAPHGLRGAVGGAAVDERRRCARRARAAASAGWSSSASNAWASPALQPASIARWISASTISHAERCRRRRPSPSRRVAPDSVVRWATAQSVPADTMAYVGRRAVASSSSRVTAQPSAAPATPRRAREGPEGRAPSDRLMSAARATPDTSRSCADR